MTVTKKARNALLAIGAGIALVAGATYSVALDEGNSCEDVLEEVREIRAYYDAADDQGLSNGERTQRDRDLAIANKAELTCTPVATTTTTTQAPTTTTVAPTTTTTEAPDGASAATWSHVTSGTTDGPQIVPDDQPNNDGVSFWHNGTFNRTDATGPQHGSVYEMHPAFFLNSGDVLRAEWTDLGGVERWNEHVVGGASTTTTTASTTTTTSGSTTTTTSTPPSSGTMPTFSNTGPRVSNPQVISGNQFVGNGTLSLVDVVVDGTIFVDNGTVILDHVRVTRGVIARPRTNGAIVKVHILDSSLGATLDIGLTDPSNGNLAHGATMPVDLLVQDSYVRTVQGSSDDHTEAVAGWGYSQGARFLNVALVQEGPFNGTATATMNWHGRDTVFDGCWFHWGGTSAAAYYTVYVDGPNNLVQNSALEAAVGDYVYPGSPTQATYVNNRDFDTGAVLTLP